MFDWKQSVTASFFIKAVENNMHAYVTKEK